MVWKNYINSDPKILIGNPVIKGTRIPVDLLLEKLAAGNSQTDLLKAYPRLTKKVIQACLFYAADIAKHKKVIFAS
jgi:uncharacterized protein (DUF433 family)